MISVSRQSEASGRLFFVVDCQVASGKGGDVSGTRSKKFRCDGRGFEDSDARARAVRFATATDMCHAFGAFLFSSSEGDVVEKRAQSDYFDGSAERLVSYVSVRYDAVSGLKFAVATCLSEISGQPKNISFLCEGKFGRGDVDVQRAVLFLRSAALSKWRRGELLQPLPASWEASGNHERALKHPWALVEIEGGEKVDCACGSNRSRGLMVACERCGAWEHAECPGFKSDKQVISQPEEQRHHLAETAVVNIK